MDPILIGISGIVFLFILLFLGVHIGVALGITGILGMALMVGVDGAVSAAVNVFYYKVASFALITIPLFVLMGYLASAGDLSKNIFRTLHQWFGGFKSGIGIATVLSCTFFGTICGSSLVTASVFSVTAAPEMRRSGYEKKLAYGICASAGMIGMLIPPSILMVIYGVFSGESVGKLLIAGIAPGILIAVLFSLTIMVLVKLKPELIQANSYDETGSGKRFSWNTLYNIWPVIVVAVVIFGGIFGGVFSPTEAGAVAVLVIFIVLMILKRRDAWKLVTPAIVNTLSTSAMIFLVLGGAAIFSQFLVLAGIAGDLAEFVKSLQLSKYALISIIALFYLILGCLLDSISMLSITIPLFNPLAEAYGMDPIWYAVVVIVSIEIGLITPPVGLNAYASKSVAEADVTLENIFLGVLPFFFVALLSVVIIIIFPWLSTILPSMMFQR